MDLDRTLDHLLAHARERLDVAVEDFERVTARERLAYRRELQRGLERTWMRWPPTACSTEEAIGPQLAFAGQAIVDPESMERAFSLFEAIGAGATLMLNPHRVLLVARIGERARVLVTVPARTSKLVQGNGGVVLGLDQLVELRGAQRLDLDLRSRGLQRANAHLSITSNGNATQVSGLEYFATVRDIDAHTCLRYASKDFVGFLQPFRGLWDEEGLGIVDDRGIYFEAGVADTIIRAWPTHTPVSTTAQESLRPGATATIAPEAATFIHEQGANGYVEWANATDATQSFHGHIGDVSWWIQSGPTRRAERWSGRVPSSGFSTVVDVRGRAMWDVVNALPSRSELVLSASSNPPALELEAGGQHRAIPAARVMSDRASKHKVVRAHILDVLGAAFRLDGPMTVKLHETKNVLVFEQERAALRNERFYRRVEARRVDGLKTRRNHTMNNELMEAMTWVGTLDPGSTVAELRERAAADAGARRLFQIMTVNELLGFESVDLQSMGAQPTATTAPQPPQPVQTKTLEPFDHYLESVLTTLQALGAEDERVVTKEELILRAGGDRGAVERAIDALASGCSILAFGDSLFSTPRTIRAALPPALPEPMSGPRELRLVSAITGERLEIPAVATPD